MNKTQRFLFIDLLRGLALIVMIEVHVFNTFLDVSVRSEPWFRYMNFVNGLVAPAFLFVSGMVFILSLQRGLDELRTYGLKFRKKIGRLLLILIAGYSLRIPYFSFSKMINRATPEMLLQFYSVDVLQSIAFGLLFLFAFRLLIRGDEKYYSFLWASLIIVLVSSPFIWRIDFNNFGLKPLTAYLNNSTGSLFPVFPWINFILAGAITGRYFSRAADRNGIDSFIKKLLYAGIIFTAVGVLFPTGWLKETLGGLTPNPFFFMQRLGIVLLLLYVCYYWSIRKENYKSVILDVSRESLLVYWLHLQLIYRKIYGGKGLDAVLGNGLNLLQCIFITIILIALMIGAAKAWGYLKNKRPDLMSKLTFTLISGSFLLFFIL